MPTALEEQIGRARDGKERALIRAQGVRDALLSEWPSGREREVPFAGGRVLRFTERPEFILGAEGAVVGVDAMVQLFRANGQEIPIDPHRRIVNVPTKVPDGTFRNEEVILVPGQPPERVRLANMREAPAEAWMQAVAESITGSPNERGWRTRGTVTSVFSDAADGSLQAASNTYSLAQTGSAAGVQANIRAGQFLSSPTYGIDEGFLGFDLSGISAADVATAVVLSLYGSINFSTQDFTAEARLTADFGTLAAGDWIALTTAMAALTKVATFATSGFSTVAYNDFAEEGSNFRTAASDAFGGSLFLVTTSDRCVAGTTPTTFETVIFHASEASGTTQDPKLVITHEVGAKPANAMFQYRRRRV